MNLSYRGLKGPLNRLIDNTDINAEDEGEWKARKDGCAKRRIA